MNDRYESGLEVRRAVLGSEYVDEALGDPGQEPSALQQLVTEFGWGSVWRRGTLPRSIRSLVTLALLTALNRPHELKVHLRGAVNNGCTEEEIREIILHCAPYCGLPAAIDSMRILDQFLADPGRATTSGKQPHDPDMALGIAPGQD